MTPCLSRVGLLPSIECVHEVSNLQLITICVRLYESTHVVYVYEGHNVFLLACGNLAHKNPSNRFYAGSGP
jgi:hypothetical protein